MFKNVISLLLLSIFLFLRTVDCHVISHFFSEDHIVDCEICDHIVLSDQGIPLISAIFNGVTSTSHNSFKEYKVYFCYKTSQYYSITQPQSIYNKPPPALS